MPFTPGSVDFTDTGNNLITNIQGGHSFVCTVVLDSVTPSALSITLSIPNNTSVIIAGGAATPAGVDVTLTMAANSDRVSVTCSTNAVSSNEVVRFTATANGSSVHNDLTITP